MMPSLSLALSVFHLVAVVTSATTYNYVVVGGGTTGLVIANRLSENPAVTVAVIEAGGSVYNNPQVTNINGYGSAFGTAIDWAFSTTAQSFADNQAKTLRAGKCIGGTSAINGMAYTRAQNVQIDSWQTIGSPGWNWTALLPYYLKSETIQGPTAQQKSLGASYNPSLHGTSGPLKVGFSTVGGANSILGSTMKNLNVSTVSDVNGGLMHGYTVNLHTVDTTLNIREDAGRAYYWPIANRANLHMYANTSAQRVVWSSDVSNGARAIGVSVTSGGVTSTISATKEVILAAGSLRTPALLELSGVGNPTILSAAGVKTVVNLPAVGENLQDQINSHIVAKNSTPIASLASDIIYPTAQDIFGSSLASVKSDLLANLTAYANKSSALSNNATKAADLMKLYKLQYDQMFDGQTPLAEILLYTNNINVEYWFALPFSRGSVHITSSSPSVPAAINPNYFALEFDIRAQIAVSQYVRKMLKTAPLSNYVGTETTPGTTKVPTNANEATWFAWMKTNYRPNYHLVGSTAMRPREIGGVVDSNLKVYGTQNVRVVDASMWPTQVSGHLMSTLFAVAERAADLIKAAA